MKILVIADVESKYLWDYFEKSKVEGIDLIISCGDLDPRYLSFLVTLANAPVLYVHGNHDKKYAQVHRRAVSALRTRFTSIRVSVFWGWAVPCAISPDPISIRRAR